MGRAIVREPQAFLFDEPLSNLDAKLRVQMRAEIRRLHNRLRATSIFVTHDQVEAMTLGSRVVVMKDGYVQQVGEPLEIYGKPANKFVAGFIGSPAMNFLPVTVSETSGSIFLETNGLRTKVPASKMGSLQAYKGQAVTLGIRPEDLRVGSGADSADLAFDAVVEVVEPLGSEILLNVSVGGQSVVCRVEPSIKAKPHEKIRMAFVPERIHFFEAKTEAVIK
jgi:multiple sugar transport system ATP-binding protein